MHEIEEHWDDMQFYAFIDRLIAKNKQAERDREAEKQKAEWRKKFKR